VIPSRLVLATANPGKVAELRQLALEWGTVDVRSLAEFPGVVLPQEDGATYAANAGRKAHAVAVATGLPALADDSGLEVDALAGAPGVHSARFAPSDDERIAKLLSALRGVADRTARFRAVVVLAWPDGRDAQGEGLCAGRIAETPDGGGGFGYDPVFVADDLGHTFGAATPAEKARVSHRARAMRALGARLTSSALRRPGAPC
jgi:XTP/dITP diphosphohydrolase